jgi:hypothetical protein
LGEPRNTDTGLSAAIASEEEPDEEQSDRSRASLEPLADAAMLFAVSDACGYHMLDSVGDRQPGAELSAAA